MILIIAIGHVVDGMVFKSMERHVQHKWGLTPSTWAIRRKSPPPAAN
jgi:predicted transcriptional regulator